MISLAEFIVMFRIIIFVTLFACQFLQYCYASESDVNNVFVSILPQKYVAERVAGVAAA